MGCKRFLVATYTVREALGLLLRIDFGFLDTDQKPTPDLVMSMEPLYLFSYSGLLTGLAAEQPSECTRGAVFL